MELKKDEEKRKKGICEECLEVDGMNSNLE